MGNKPRSDSKLDGLPDGQLLELRDGLLAGWKYSEALSWRVEVCGVSSSLAALSAFYSRHCKPVIKERRQLLSLKAESILDGADQSQFDVAAILKLKEMAFEMMLTEDAEPEVIEKIMRLVLKSQSQDHDARKLRIIEQKAKRADKVEELIMQRKDAGGGITEDFLATIEKALKM